MDETIIYLLVLMVALHGLTLYELVSFIKKERERNRDITITVEFIRKVTRTIIDEINNEL